MHAGVDSEGRELSRPRGTDGALGPIGPRRPPNAVSRVAVCLALASVLLGGCGDWGDDEPTVGEQTTASRAETQVDSTQVLAELQQATAKEEEVTPAQLVASIAEMYPESSVAYVSTSGPVTFEDAIGAIEARGSAGVFIVGSGAGDKQLTSVQVDALTIVFLSPEGDLACTRVDDTEVPCKG